MPDRPSAFENALLRRNESRTHRGSYSHVEGKQGIDDRWIFQSGEAR